LTFGTYEGRRLSEVPGEYLIGLSDQGIGLDAQSRTAIREVIDRAGREDRGRQVVVEARVPDDDPRLEAEGYLAGLQGELIDVAIHREVLLVRAQARMGEKKYAEAKELLGEIEALKTREKFRNELQQERKKIATNDPLLDRKIDRMFKETDKVLMHYLDPDPVKQLATALLRVQEARGAGS
jgi:hypothetical protein